MSSAAAALFYSPSAMAQEASSTKETAQVLGEVIVTAQHRAERLQEVPIAISAVASEQLSDRGVGNLQALNGMVPGLVLTGTSGANSSNQISIRGISGQANPIGQSQTVAVYIDGGYVARPDGAFFALDDVERIEVLRGPQGTLYGRNSTGGAINIITRLPGDELRGGIDASYGNFNYVQMKGSISGPIGGGLAAGFSGSYESRDGWFRNSVTGNKVGTLDAFTLRGTVTYKSPDGDFRATLTGDYSERQEPIFFRNIYSSIAGGTLLSLSDPWVINSDALSERRSDASNESSGGVLTLEYRVNDNVDVTSLTSMRSFSSDTHYDLDGTPTPAVFANNHNEVNTFSQELRAVATFGATKATVGGNYYHEKQEFGTTPAASPTIFAPLTGPLDKSNLDAAAVFAQVEYGLTKQLTLVGGLRYNVEHREFSNDYRFAYNNAGLPTPGPLLTGKINDKVLIPSFGVNFQATPDLLVYAKFSRGYQAPGFNVTPGATIGTPPVTRTTPNVFDAETLDAYEAGVKSQFLDRRMTLNLAAFHYNYNDLQVRTTVGVGVINIQNAATAKVDGLEGSLSVTPIEGLTFDGNLTYLKSVYDGFCERITAGSPQNSDPLCSPGVANRSGNYLINAPRWQGGASVNYERAVGDAGQARFNLTYVYQSNSFYSSDNSPQVSSGKIERLNARAGFQLINGPELYVYGKNLTENFNADYVLRGGPTFVVQDMSDPRTYGVGVRYRF